VWLLWPLCLTDAIFVLFTASILLILVAGMMAGFVDVSFCFVVVTFSLATVLFEVVCCEVVCFVCGAFLAATLSLAELLMDDANTF